MIALENITVRGGRKVLLDNITADFSGGLCWVITGSNGSGKSVLGKVIGGITRPGSGRITGCAVTGYTSFELQEQVLAAEKHKDETRLMHGAVDEGTKVHDFLFPDENKDLVYAEKLVSLFSVSSILERGLRFLSTGEFRKVLLLRALLEKPDLLVIDDPFDGLDASSRDHLKSVINELIKTGSRIILISGRIEDYPDEATHMLLLSDGTIKYIGDIRKGTAVFREEHQKQKEGIVSGSDDPLLAEQLLGYKSSTIFKNPGSSDISISGKNAGMCCCNDSESSFFHAGDISYASDHDNRTSSESCRGAVLIDMIDTSVSYNGRTVLDRINWKVRRGEKWKITGANGVGKSTLLSLVNGDNPQSYANNISLFGIKRGTGESIWDIKKNIGFVSGDFQFKYRVRCKVLDAVISGLFDSVGLYADINESEIEKGNKWLKYIGLHSKRGNFFTDLSFGEMRLVLIARAMIKDPELLILDEPCQGLDSFNRDRVLDLCEKIGREKNRTILFVTHDSAVNLKCFTNSLVLE